MKKKRWICAILSLAALTLGISSIADALPTYLTQYNAKFGKNESCTLCHTAVPALNSTGTTFLNSGHNYDSIAPAPPPSSDAAPPTITSFTIPSTSSSLTVSITAFSATDNVGVAGYMVTESKAVPSASAAGWSASVPTSYTFAAAGTKNLYSWAKDAAGNVSSSLSAKVTITLPPSPPPAPAPPPSSDTAPPTITSFTIPSTSSSLTVPITAFSATDNVGVTGYMVTESEAAPSSSAAGWSASVPTSYTFAAAGTKNLYSWAKDAAGNVSSGVSATIAISILTNAPDMTIWVGKWFKIVEKNKGYAVAGSGLNKDQATFAGYLKFWSWDPANKVLQGDRYEQDPESGQWISQPLNLNYIAGGDLDFLCWSQAADLAVAFTARIQGREINGALQSATFKTLGGYYMGASDGASAAEYWAGGLSISAVLIPEAKVLVPSTALIR